MTLLNLNANHHPGFGSTAIYRDGDLVEEDVKGRWARHARRAENMARRNPDHRWVFVISGPLASATYRRTWAGWLLAETGTGFA